MDLGLQGKRALITGGTKSIGRAIVETLAREGMTVGYCARDASLVLHPLPAGLELPQVEVMQIWHERTDADRLRRWLRQQIQQVASELRR